MIENDSKPHRFRWIGMSEDGTSVLLRRYNGEFNPPSHATADWFGANPEAWRTGAVLDVETTGTSHVSDKVIEIGLRLFRFDRETGEVLSRDEGYSALEDPGVPLSPEIVRITGITDAMLAGQRIDWGHVHKLLAGAQVILAHNAAFDRPFIDRLVESSASKIWGCSFRQVDWLEKGFPSQKLEILSIYHGFFCDAHRALADSDALLHLLGMRDAVSNGPYLGELLANARRRMAWVYATGSPFETKDLLKQRGYRWEASRKVWSSLIYADTLEAETAWLTEFIYSGYCRATVKELAPCDLFKAQGEGA